LRGQVAFESLFLFIIIITSGIYITNLYLQTHEATIAYTIVREDLVYQTNTMDNVLIKNISLAKNSSATIIKVQTEPNTLTNTDFTLEPIEEKINRATSFLNPTIQIN